MAPRAVANATEDASEADPILGQYLINLQDLPMKCMPFVVGSVYPSSRQDLNYLTEVSSLGSVYSSVMVITDDCFAPYSHRS